MDYFLGTLWVHRDLNHESGPCGIFRELLVVLLLLWVRVAFGVHSDHILGRIGLFHMDVVTSNYILAVPMFGVVLGMLCNLQFASRDT